MQGEEERPRVVSDLLDAVVGDPSHDDAALHSRGRIDVVEADAVANDAAHARRRREDRRTDRGKLDQHCVRVVRPHELGRLALVPCLAGDEVVTVRRCDLSLYLEIVAEGVVEDEDATSPSARRHIAILRLPGGAHRGSRNLHDAVGKLQRNDASKFVLLNGKNEMQAVLLTTEVHVNS
jgi:hypothetical protein